MRLTNTADFLSGHSSSAPTHQPWLARLQQAFRKYAESRAVRRRYRDDAAQLERFTDRELWDLGLSRSDVPSIAKGIYRRD